MSGRWVLRLHQNLDPVCTCAGLRTLAISRVGDAVVAASRDGALGLWSKHEGLPEDMPAGNQTSTEEARTRNKNRPMSSQIRPMRKMSDINTSTQSVMDVMADIEKKSPKNWTHGKIELRPITRSFVPGGHLHGRQCTSPLLKKDAWVNADFPKNSAAEGFDASKNASATVFLNCMEQSENLDNSENGGVARLLHARGRMIRSNSSPQLGKWASSKNARFGIATLANATSTIARKKSTSIVPFDNTPTIRSDTVVFFSAGLHVAK
jgi:hypothetical protein